MTDSNGAAIGPLLAGAATNVLPVPADVAMAGYTERRGVSSAVHDAPHVTALSFRMGNHLAVLVGVDLAAVDASLCGEVAASAGIPADCLLVGASHTHSGPDGIVDRPGGRAVDDGYRGQVREAIAATIRTALQRAEPARLRLGRAEARGVAANRNTPDKRVDHRITTLVAERPEDGRRLATLVHFPCHPTVLGPQNLHISADFPGALRRELAALDGSGDAPVLFLNGASGDVSTRFTRQGQDFAEVKRLGRLLAETASHGIRTAEPIDSSPLRTINRLVQLPEKVAVPVPEAEATLRACEGELRQARESGADAGTLRRLTTKVQGATRELVRANGAGTSETPVMISVVRLGSLAFAGISAEISSAIGAAIEAGSPVAETVVVGLSNGYCGYITDPGDYSSGTYESLSSAFQPQAAEALAQEAVSLLRGLP
jgi:hypothetical protein